MRSVAVRYLSIAGLAVLLGAAPGAQATDLCQVMVSAGAPRFGGAELSVFRSLRAPTPAAAWVRQRRCLFRSEPASRTAHRDLMVGLSTMAIPPVSFGEQLSAARAARRRFFTENEIGQLGFGWSDPQARAIELNYLLRNGRQLRIRWSGSGIDATRDVGELRAFAARVGALLD